MKSQINKTVLRANRKIALVGMTRAVSSRRTRSNWIWQLICSTYERQQLTHFRGPKP